MSHWKLALTLFVFSAGVITVAILFPSKFAIEPVSQSEVRVAERPQVYYGPPDSLAILPFSGGDAGEDQAFWSFGFSRELQQLAVRTAGIQVSSVNSSFYFDDHSTPPWVIAERLKARHILTGDFLKSGDRIQVNVGLFDAKKRVDTWTGSYQGNLGEVFEIQDKILEAVSEALGPGEDNGRPHARVVDTSAWAAYLQGIHLAFARTPAELEKAEHALQAALDIEPDYARARLALVRIWLGRSSFGERNGPLVESAREMLAAVLSSEPELPAAWGLLSYLQRNIDWDWQQAVESAARAIELSPGDPELMSIASLAMFSLGQFESSVPLLESSVRQDPLNLARRLRLGLLYEFSAELEKALSTYRQIIGLNPDFPGVRAYRARVKLIQQKPDSALEESGLEIDPFWKRYAQILALSSLERFEEADQLLEQMIAENGSDSAYQVAEIFAFRGEADQAFEWLQRAYEQKDGGMGEIMGNWFLLNLHQDSRWRQMLKRLRLPLDESE